MHRYVTDFAENAQTVNLGLGGLTSTANVRPGIYEFMFGCSGTPGDTASVYTVHRWSDAGTATAAASNPLDSADIATALGLGKENYTVQPSGTETILMRFALNQRATFRWVAAPGSEIYMPASANASTLITPTTSGHALAMEGSIFHIE
jgi:hypothetical protein